MNDEPKCEGNYYTGGGPCPSPPQEPHTCPFAVEIHGDETLCNCCPSCETACRYNI